MEDERYYNSVLLDFYGALLTPKQRECFDLHYNEDLSLSEIAEQCGISRQGVWENIRRAEAAMREIEEKTGLIRKFSEFSGGIGHACETLEQLTPTIEGQARQLALEALSELSALRTRV